MGIPFLVTHSVAYLTKRARSAPATPKAALVVVVAEEAAAADDAAEKAAAHATD